MNRKSYKETDRFNIKDEKGSLHEVIETTTFLHVDSHSGSHLVPSLKELRTRSGYHINFDGHQKYTIVELDLSGERVSA